MRSATVESAICWRHLATGICEVRISDRLPLLLLAIKQGKAGMAEGVVLLFLAYHAVLLSAAQPNRLHGDAHEKDDSDIAVLAAGSSWTSSTFINDLLQGQAARLAASLQGGSSPASYGIAYFDESLNGYYWTNINAGNWQQISARAGAQFNAGALTLQSPDPAFLIAPTQFNPPGDVNCVLSGVAHHV